jgi:hypothetical protein
MVDYFSHSPGHTNISESTCYAQYNVSSFEKGAGLRRLTFYDKKHYVRPQIILLTKFMCEKFNENKFI